MHPAPPTLTGPQEAGSLARDMAAAFRRMVETFLQKYQKAPQEAIEQAEFFPASVRDEVLNCSPEQVTWFFLSLLAQEEPELAARRWEEIRRAALDELQNGHCAGRTLEGIDPHPWQRAQYLALRDELMAAWQPTSGVERQLIDTLALAQMGVLSWQLLLTVRTNHQAKKERAAVDRHGSWDPPRVSDHVAIEQAAAMMDRFNKIYLRTLRALRDLRRYAPAVVVQHAGQVNVGGQQVNLNCQAEPALSDT